MLLPKSNFVCIPSFKTVIPIFFSGKSTIFGFLLNTERGVAIFTYLKRSPGDTDSIYNIYIFYLFISLRLHVPMYLY